MPYTVNSSDQCAYVSINAQDASSARGLEEKGCVLTKQNMYKKTYCCGFAAAEEGTFSSGGLVIGPRQPGLVIQPEAAIAQPVTTPSDVVVTEEELAPPKTWIERAKAFYQENPKTSLLIAGIGALAAIELLKK